ncbi:MAG: ABC transporter ATP-binding protein [Chloroflexi bacterium]|nr:ABC transporter ATP-binding protein [Chloroflexota bacterium]
MRRSEPRPKRANGRVAIHSDRHLLSVLGVFLKPYALHMVIVLLFLCVVTAMTALLPYIVQLAIDGPIIDRDLPGLYGYAAAYFIVVAILFVARFAHTYLLQSVGQSVLANIRQAMFERMIRMELGHFQRTPVGHLVSRLTNDIEAVTELLSTSIVMVVSHLITLIGLMLAMMLINWRLALLVFGVLPLMMILSIQFRRKIRFAASRFHRLVADYQGFLNEQFNGMLVVQLFNREAHSQADFETINSGYRDLHKIIRDSYTRYSSKLQLLSAVGLAVLLYGGGRGVLAEWATLGTLISFIQYSRLSYEPIQQLAEQFSQIQQAFSAVERIVDVLELEPAIQSPGRPIKLAAFSQSVQIHEMSFHYHPKKPVLNNVTLQIQSGQRIALVGETGVGKTTLASLIARMYDVKAGSICIDGVDLREVSLEELPRYVSLVPQNPYIFDGTIADNLRLFDESIGEDQLREAAQIACAEPFIQQLNGGYDHHLLPGGADLSEGQRQLLALARALVHSPNSILILDEATSNIDTETDELIQQGLERALRGRTSIIIAHRLSTIRNADRILVMIEGEIAEDGSHEELMQLDGSYAELFQRQFATSAWH